MDAAATVQRQSADLPQRSFDFLSSSAMHARPDIYPTFHGRAAARPSLWHGPGDKSYTAEPDSGLVFLQWQ
jgi:hypothetical protein